MTDSAVSDQNRDNVLCCLDGVWTVSCGTGMIRGDIFHCNFLKIDSRLHPYLSARIMENRDAVGTYSGQIRNRSVVFYHAKVTNRIRIGLRTG